MKDYFIRLFEYDRYANQLIAETIAKGNNPKKPVKLMAHLLAAQQIWFNRCKGLSAANVELWSDGDAGEFAGTITLNSVQWINYLDGLQTDDFGKIVQYKTLRGDAYENKLEDILAHVVNHGTHHRAQIGQHLLIAGLEGLPMTDYIFFLRA